MSETDNVADLSDAREARKMRDALVRLDEAARAERIDAGSYLGRYHAAVMLVLEHMDTLLREERTRREKSDAADEERKSRMMEAAQETAERFQAQARDELAKLDRMARKAEADNRRQELALQENVAKLIQRLSADLVAGIKHGNVIRAKAYSRDQFSKMVAAGVLSVMVLVALGIGIDRSMLSHRPAYAAAGADEGN